MDYARWKAFGNEFKDKFGDFISLLESCEQPGKFGHILSDLSTYTLQGGKHIRGALVPSALDAFCADEANMVQLVHSAHMVGWCVEMLHAGFLILDDIMDNSAVRRGKPSWFKVQADVGHGLAAVNDGLHLCLTAKYLLQRIGKQSDKSLMIPSHTRSKLMELFDEIGYKTCWGQCLDLRCSSPITSPSASTADSGANDGDKDHHCDLDKFTKPNFESITQWKTGYYTFYLPIACGMALAGVEDEHVFSGAKNILLKLGQFFQAQDDFLDCFGDINVTGKVGTDIAEGKCTWLVVECLAKCSTDQKMVIEEHYGREDAESQTAVRALYEELKLPDAFRAYEKKLRGEILNDIDSWKVEGWLSADPRPMFRMLVDYLFGRSG